MRPCPDPAPAVAALEAIARNPVAAWDTLAGAAAVGGLDEHWPLIEAQRAAGVLPGAALLARLDRDLDAWDRRFAIATARPAACAVAAQAWLVQDLHCLADLHNHAGDGQGAAWSRRGHEAEGALHRELWDGTAYRDRDDAGHLVAAGAGEACQPLLLLDTPAERVAAIAPLATAQAALGGPLARLVAIGLARHRR
jgi:hypothetical protein